MAENTLEREYVVPLRRAWLHVPHYNRTSKAIKTIKKFIAKHMKVEDRDPNKVKLDVYLNNDLWFRGRANPPSRVKVKARKEAEKDSKVQKHVTQVKEPKIQRMALKK